MAKDTFEQVDAIVSFPQLEERIRAFWSEESIYARQKELRKDAPPFVFYEGPPTANGLPHNGHVLTRVIKDVIPRYRTMQGFHVPRKAGWDTHGLPVEIEVEKELGIRGKDAIRDYGVEPFVRKCLESVFKYTKEWERNTNQLAFWVDLDDPYVTYHQSYVESVWWALSKLYEKGLLYEGYKVIAWWAQGGTALSQAEVNEGYKEVQDPSVFARFPLVDDPGTELVAWTTTPWTLPSNTYAAVNAKYDYAYVQDGETTLVVAAELVEGLAKKLKRELELVKTVKGSELVGLRYVPPFDWFKDLEADYWRVVAADFVSLDAGTGIVHCAPAFGEDDFKVLQLENRERRDAGQPELPLICPVMANGKYDPEQAPELVANMWVKDADKVLVRDLKERGKLLHLEQYKHKYPFCPRSPDDPLIYIARPAWYIRTTREIQRAIDNNAQINWLPEHIRDGRFGDFLRNNVDWALSRERFWGTPLPVWRNDVTGALDVPSSVADILARNPNAFDAFEQQRASDPELSPHLKVHKPYIDAVTWTKEGEEGVYRRVSEVIDCWFDSGSMPFAQWGYPHQGQEEFARYFPADFISEAIDQTRGWFYTLLMVSTLLFEEQAAPHPYKTCIVLGHVCDSQGKKESKSKGNYTPPEVILDHVRIQMAVVDAEGKLKDPPEGTLFVAPEDYEGLDLKGKSTQLLVYRGDRSEAQGRTLKVVPTKGVARRHALVNAADRESFGVSSAPKGTKTMPKEVPSLPGEHVLWLEDPTSPAPGADAFRWFFYASNPPWNSTRHSLTAVRQTQRELPFKLRNVLKFFAEYANIDGFDPSDAACQAGQRPTSERAELDRWILSELALTNQAVVGFLDDFRIYEAAQVLTDFTDGLSNWYVRRCRARFWAKGLGPDKLDAHWTLYTCLTTLAKLLAPFLPYASEDLWQNLVRRPLPDAEASVHLADYPAPVLADVDERLSQVMGAVREVVSLGLQVRASHKLAVRQALQSVTLVLSDESLRSELEAHAEQIREELNVKELEFAAKADAFVNYKVKPNFKLLGQKLRGDMPKVKKLLLAAKGEDLLAELSAKGCVTLDVEGKAVELAPEEVNVVLEEKEGFAASSGKVGVIVLATELTPELIAEGLYREVQRRVQDLRKQRDLAYTDRIELWLSGDEELVAAAEAHREALCSETLTEALHLREAAPVGVEASELEVKGRALVIGLRVQG
ncbi:MAG TPA: isoleucine--tRNA ligase [Planctomycetes bacterium]|nr:isoleucine--tRNA ligase [Planctomycetota bacterium]